MMSSLVLSAVKRPLLLIVEDSNEDFETLQRFLQRSPMEISIKRCVNGEQALAFLYRTGNYSDNESTPGPSLIILDINLPKIDGLEVLRQIKQDDKLKKIPIVVFTTSSNPKDIKNCYQYGVNSYIVKAINFAQLKQDIQLLMDYWFKVTMLPDQDD